MRTKLCRGWPKAGFALENVQSKVRGGARFSGYVGEQMAGRLHADFDSSMNDGACDGIAASRCSRPVKQQA